MITRAEKIRLGIFLGVTLIILVGTIGTLVGIKIFSPKDVYYAPFTVSVSGLEIGAPVKLSGVRVGMVEDIYIEPEDITKVMVVLSLREGTPVKEDMAATMEIQGITGLKFIDLKGGSIDSPLLSPGSELKTAGGIVEELTGKATDIAYKIELLINNLMKITDASNQERLVSILETTDSLLKNADETLTENRESINHSLANLARVSENLLLTSDKFNEIIDDNHPKLNKTFRNIQLMTEELRTNLLISMEELRANLNFTIDEFRTNMGKVIDVERIGQTLINLDETLILAKEQIGDKGIVKAIKNLNRVIKDIQKIVEGIDRTVFISRENIFRITENLKESAENINELTRTLRDNPSLFMSAPQRPERKLP